ncbi:MAG: hypothetical protein QXK74_07470 [Candidatus Nitrosocaldaceae archaeon]
MKRQNSCNIHIKGHFVIRDAITHHIYYKSDNLIVNTGKERLAEIILPSGGAMISQIGVGSNNTPPAVNQTNLLSPILWKDVDERSVYGATATFRTYFLSNEANGTWREVGIRANTSNNFLIARQVIPDLTKTNTMTVLVEWSLTFI